MWIFPAAPSLPIPPLGSPPKLPPEIGRGDLPLSQAPMTPAQIECEAYLLQALGARFGILIEAYPATILRDRLSKSKTDLSRRDPSLHEPLSNLTIRLHPTNPNWVQIVKSNIKEALELEDTTHSLKPPSPPSNRR